MLQLAVSVLKREKSGSTAPVESDERPENGANAEVSGETSRTDTDGMASKRDKKAVEVASDPQPTSAAGDPEDYTDALARQLNLPPWSWKAGGTHQVETEDPVAVPPERIDEDLENFGSDVQAAVKDITGKDG